jgi:hypothetical protein
VPVKEDATCITLECGDQSARFAEPATQLWDVPTACACAQACFDAFPSCAAFSFLTVDVNTNDGHVFPGKPSEGRRTVALHAAFNNTCYLHTTSKKARSDFRFRGRAMPPVVTSVRVVAEAAYDGLPLTVRSGDAFSLKLEGHFFPSSAKEARSQTLAIVPKGKPCMATTVPRALGMRCSGLLCHWTPSATSESGVTFSEVTLLGEAHSTLWDACYCRGPCFSEHDFHRIAVVTVLPEHMDVAVTGDTVVAGTFTVALSSPIGQGHPRRWRLDFGLKGCHALAKAKALGTDFLNVSSSLDGEGTLGACAYSSSPCSTSSWTVRVADEIKAARDYVLCFCQVSDVAALASAEELDDCDPRTALAVVAVGEKPAPKGRWVYEEVVSYFECPEGLEASNANATALEPANASNALNVSNASNATNLSRRLSSTNASNASNESNATARMCSSVKVVPRWEPPPAVAPLAPGLFHEQHKTVDFMDTQVAFAGVGVQDLELKLIPGTEECGYVTPGFWVDEEVVSNFECPEQATNATNSSNSTNASNATVSNATVNMCSSVEVVQRWEPPADILPQLTEVVGKHLVMSIDTINHASPMQKICSGNELFGTVRYSHIAKEKWLIGTAEWSGIELTANPPQSLEAGGRLVLVPMEAQCGYSAGCYNPRTDVQVGEAQWDCQRADKLYFPVYSAHAQTLKVCFCVGDCVDTMELGTLDVSPLACSLEEHELTRRPACRKNVLGAGLTCPGRTSAAQACPEPATPTDPPDTPVTNPANPTTDTVTTAEPEDVRHFVRIQIAGPKLHDDFSDIASRRCFTLHVRACVVLLAHHWRS